jgi:cytochrome P450
MADIHKKYGAVVRMAPDELSFATKEAWQDIYVHRPGHKNPTKSEVWYKGSFDLTESRNQLMVPSKAPQGMPQNIVTAIDHADHARMRRAFSSAFSEKTLRDQEPVIERYADLAMRQFRAMAIAPETDGKGVVLNMVDWLNFFTIDVIGDLGFGESFGCLQDSAYHPWVKTLHNFLKAMVFAAATRFYPSVEALFMAMLPQSILELQKRHTEFANERVRRRLNLETSRPDFITPILKDDSAHKSMTIPEIQSNMAILMIAGSEATATILSGAITYLLRNRESLRKLVTEVRTSFKREKDITISNSEELLYLNATLSEALRLCNPVPGALPRVVGRGGDTICNVFVPEQVSESLSGKFTFGVDGSITRLQSPSVHG